MGIERLRAIGLNIRVLDQVSAQHFTFAGTDEQRAAAFLELMYADDIDILWCARGGYGATRLLPLLSHWTRGHRGARLGRAYPDPQVYPLLAPYFRRPRTVDPKLLVGYSDVTALHHFARTRWRWPTLHAPMPGEFHADKVQQRHLDALLAFLKRRKPRDCWSDEPLEFIGSPPKRPVEGEVIGGNLTLWACLCGTPFQPICKDRILFFEDIGEAWYRIDRMVHQMLQAGIFNGVRGVLLGDFTDCNDEKQMVRASPADPAKKQPLRPTYDQRQALSEIFGWVGRQLGIPVAVGLPVGHGSNCAPLPLGATYRLTPRGRLELLEWEWLAR